MSHPIQCSCGAVKGNLSNTRDINRCVCYCRDCQAFAHFLGRQTDILDSRGGSDIVQTLPKYVSFSAGTEHLACMRLTDKGLLRWYASCCNTPIGNTAPNFSMSFVGLVHNCLEAGGASMDAVFGPVSAHVNTENARGGVRVKSKGFAKTLLKVLGMVARARIDGSYRKTPFFNVEKGMPIVTPTILNAQERLQLMDGL
ncbi:MAG TPA: DUF6151 family protein [Candidatus Kapabacteria bacterium]|nr:DUF6151 family protein [Candidatus Kapabacteria bacterium]